MAENHLLKKQIENLEGTLAKEINNKEKDFKLIEEVSRIKNIFNL
jgi:hypothetical protein